MSGLIRVYKMVLRFLLGKFKNLKIKKKLSSIKFSAFLIVFSKHIPKKNQINLLQDYSLENMSNIT